MEHYIITKDIQLYNRTNKSDRITVQRLNYNAINFTQTFGIDVPEEEKELFSANIAAWTHFYESSKEDICLITEEGADLQMSLNDMDNDLRKFDHPWDVLFPYDKIHHTSENLPISVSRFGFFWGTYSYFVHRKGIPNLLHICRSIAAPLDELLLVNGIKKKITLQCVQTDWFKFDQLRSISFLARTKSVNSYVNNYAVWNEQELEEVQTLLKYISSTATEIGVKVFLHAGSLLGAIRHGKIMDWDDDVDLMINERDSDKLINSILHHNKYRVTKWYWLKTGKVYYKIWKPGGYKVEGYEYTFPFIDIWTVEIDRINNTAVTNDGYEFKYDTYYPLSETCFEGAKFYLPNKSLDILNRMYKGWREQIKIFSWSHKLKQHSIRQITAFIETDENGKFLNYK